MNASAKPLLSISCATMNLGRPEELLARRSRNSNADLMLLKTIVGFPTTSRYITSPGVPQSYQHLANQRPVLTKALLAVS